LYNWGVRPFRRLTRRAEGAKPCPRAGSPTRNQSIHMFSDDVSCAARLRALQQIARPTAHELHGGLNALKIHLELLAGTMASSAGAGEQDRRQGHLDVVRAECAHVQRVADAFLALASPLSEPAEADPGSLVAGVVDAVRPVALVRGVRLEGGPYPPAVGRVPVPATEACRQRLLDALLDVLAEASRGSTVSVVMADGGGWARIEPAGGNPVTVMLAERCEGADA
jgi:signal transduction histidine kinase